jgi:hypothetical protein
VVQGDTLAQDMVRHALRVGMGLAALGCAAVWAQKRDAPPTSEGSTPAIQDITAGVLSIGSTVQYDGRKWTLVKRAKLTLEPDATPSNAVLLKSLESTDTGGAGQPLNDVNLLVLRDSRVVYDSMKQGVGPPDSDTRFYMDDNLEIGNVTNDSAPEVLFHSGYEGASDAATFERVIRYDKSRDSFTDISPASFYNSGTHGLRWLSLKRQTVAVIADQKWSPRIPLEDRCHYCPSPFQYEAFRWSSEKGSFVAFRHLSGRKAYSDASEALIGDWTLIQSGLTN